MRWYEKLWVGPGAQKKKKKILSAIEKQERFLQAYVICLSQSPYEQLEILPSRMLGSPGCPEESLYVLGIAIGKQEAMELVAEMAEQIYRETGNLNMKQYFLN